MKREDLLHAAREALRETAPDRFDELSPLLELPAFDISCPACQGPS